MLDSVKIKNAWRREGGYRLTPQAAATKKKKPPTCCVYIFGMVPLPVPYVHERAKSAHVGQIDQIDHDLDHLDPKLPL